jgi:TetR/AcrR family transcriptional regulator, cholesterol catabolism regulator
MPDIEVSRRERKKEETKERILQAAFQLFRKHGVEATTVDQICECADIAKGTFFNYFPRKEEVFGFLSEQWVAEAERRVAEALEHGPPTWEQARDTFIEFAAYYEEDRELAKYMALEWTRGMHDPDNAVCRRWDALGHQVVGLLQSRGALRRDVDPVLIHRILGDIYHDTIVMWLESPEPPFSLQDELRRRLTLVVEGLAARHEEGR